MGARKNKIRITFVLPSLRAGGAERVVSYLAQNLNKDFFDCRLIIIGFEKSKVYDVETVPVFFLNKKRALFGNIAIFNLLRKHRPDIVFSCIAHVNVMMGLQSVFFPKTKFIGREAIVRSTFQRYNPIKKRWGFVSDTLSKIAYRHLDKIVCQSKDMAHDLNVNYNFPKSKLIIINNPISDTLKTKSEIPALENNKYRLITVGRLALQKGHNRILDALAILNLPFKYTIIGDGPEKQNILNYAEELGLSANIIHIPFTTKVFEYLTENHLFLQGSYVEGFPNALLESCAIGTPVVAFNAPGGIDEIIENGRNGFLADTVNEFAQQIAIVLNSLPQWEPNSVSQSVFKKYSSKKILRQYENLFTETTRN